jgi:hypothetical protein
MANIFPAMAPFARQARELEFRERVDQLHTYCYVEQKSRDEKIALLASSIIAILSFTIFRVYLSLLAIPCTCSIFFLSLLFFKNVSFPFDAYREVISDLDKSRPEFTYDFARFAEERGILSPDTVIEAHQIFKQHIALLAQNARMQIAIA